MRNLIRYTILEIEEMYGLICWFPQNSAYFKISIEAHHEAHGHCHCCLASPLHWAWPQELCTTWLLHILSEAPCGPGWGLTHGRDQSHRFSGHSWSWAECWRAWGLCAAHWLSGCTSDHAGSGTENSRRGLKTTSGIWAACAGLFPSGSAKERYDPSKSQGRFCLPTWTM